jgi:hypothetical protein
VNKEEIFKNLPLKYEVRLLDKSHPEVFYIGKGKTGSASIFNGIKDKAICHWHGTEYYESIHGTSILSTNGLTIYDYIEWVNENIHPVKIIECYRDPVAQFLSSLFQWFASTNANRAKKIFLDFYPKITFQIELEKPNSKLEVIYLKTEESELWSDILSKHDLIYVNNFKNKRDILQYNKLKEELKIPKWKLDIIYSDSKLNSLYTKEEIAQFYARWGY